MYKALQTIQRSYLRTPLRQFVLSQKQFAPKRTISQRDVAMTHNLKEPK